MTKKTIFMFTFCLAALTAKAVNPCQDADTLIQQILVSEQEMLKPLTPTYLRNVTEAANWGRNWFIDIKGGASSFLGSPLGCEDVFGRTEPVFQVGIGKWFTPAIGVRVVGQGFTFKDYSICTAKYQAFHADFLYNLGQYLPASSSDGMARWDVVPYVGIGLMHYASPWSLDEEECMCRTTRYPFNFSYGLQTRYRLARRLHLTAELGGISTFGSFDGKGNKNRIGDHLLSLSAGISVTLGKVGWKRIIDAKPYIIQNDWLINYSDKLIRKNHHLILQHVVDQQTIDELRKILEIEGLLDKYRKVFDESRQKQSKEYKRNSYGGLQSLRARLKNRQWNGRSELPDSTWNATSEDMDSADDMNGNSDTASFNAYLSSLLDGKSAVGAPIYFFFHIGTSNLTDESQLVNLDEIARVAKKYDLHIRVEGAADSATGTPEGNDRLSTNRSKYIGQQLLDRGIKASHIKAVSLGGVDKDVPDAVNRRTKVTLYLK